MKEEKKQKNMAGRSVMWLGAKLTLTIYPAACSTFGNQKANTLNEAKHTARADFFEQTKIKSWRCHIKQREREWISEWRYQLTLSRKPYHKSWYSKRKQLFRDVVKIFCGCHFIKLHRKDCKGKWAKQEKCWATPFVLPFFPCWWHQHFTRLMVKVHAVYVSSGKSHEATAAHTYSAADYWDSHKSWKMYLSILA